MTHMAAGIGGHTVANQYGTPMRMGQQRIPIPSDEIILPPREPQDTNSFQPPIRLPDIPGNGKTAFEMLLEKAKENPLITIGVLLLVAKMTRII